MVEHMRILKVGGTGDGAIAQAAEAIRSGGLVIYPTETVYGLGADACSGEAVAKVFAAKARPIEEPMSIAVGSLEVAREFTVMTPEAERVFKKFMPGPLTVILRPKPAISKLLMAGTNSVGVRVPDHPVALRLLELFGGPITSTSANVSGRPPPSTVEDVVAQVGRSTDIALDAGRCKLGVGSTVVDMTKEPFEVVRKGPISIEDILSG